MARRTKEEAQQTRCHIMSTALDLFCSQGLAKTSLTDIARAADLTRGAIYWHFKNKDELFISLWKELCSPLAHQLDACLNTDEPDPLGQLRLFFEGVLHSFIHNPAQRQMFTLLFNLESLEGEAISLREHIRSEMYEGLAGEHAPYNLKFVTNGVSCTTVSIITAALGIRDLGSIDAEQLAQWPAQPLPATVLLRRSALGMEVLGLRLVRPAPPPADDPEPGNPQAAAALQPALPTPSLQGAP